MGGNEAKRFKSAKVVLGLESGLGLGLVKELKGRLEAGSDAAVHEVG
jgi:hypothetical protein